MTALQTAVLDLADARDFAFAGGKAVNLAELLGAGFPVPDGFCVGTPAYAQAADTAGIAALLDAPDLPVRARDALLATPDPRRRRRRGHRRLPRARRGGAGRGAVVGHRRGPPGRELRGSAGHLPQRGRRRRRAGRACAAAGRRSGRTGPWPTAPTRASPHAGTQLAVVVQRMVDAQAAGVLFTADPITGRRSRSVHRRRAPAWARRSSPARSTPTTRGRRRPDRRPARRQAVAIRPARRRHERVPHRPARCLPTPARRAAALGRASRRTSARRRTSSGPSTARARCGSPSPAPITTLYPLPPPRSAGPARATSRLAGPGPHPPDHADGPRRRSG